jgi:iron complex outermembrane receptor protein
LPHEELDEKGTMKPGDIKMLLTETTGISTQQTSAVSGTANFRIQGLDGRYTQLLKDGMPLYNGFSGGLSIMQIPPLDLQQVEMIKGSSSTLYGGGAIAGLVNLISKTPQEKRELDFLLNANSAKGFDVSNFYSQKWKNIGATIFSAYNFNAPYDPANIGLTAIPKTNRFTVNPKMFLYFNKKTSAWFGVNTTYEDRYGGDMNVVEGKADSIHQYFERNKTFRLSTQLSFTHQINDNTKINFKNSIGFFDRKLFMPGYNFDGREVSSFSEFNYVHTQKRTEWIAGLNEWTDNFTPLDTTTLQYHLTTIGAFVQNTFNASKWFSLETGLRIDHNSPATKNNSNGLFVLPRLNALLKFNQHFTSRIGGGLGYKMPTPFTDEAEEQGYKDILPINFQNVEAEKSYGLNADINFRTHVDEFSINMNQLFFYTYVKNPIELQENNFVNINGYVDTKGTETNLRIGWNDLTFYLGYTFADVNEHINKQTLWQPLSPKHRLNADLTYEVEDKLRIGLESYYTSEQLLTDGSTGRSYLIFGLLIQKMWDHFSIYINGENLTDQRQTRWEMINAGTITNPAFKDIYAPLDGVVVNGGIKINL